MFTPQFHTFGEEARVPIEVIIGIAPREQTTSPYKQRRLKFDLQKISTALVHITKLSKLETKSAFVFHHFLNPLPNSNRNRQKSMPFPNFMESLFANKTPYRKAKEKSTSRELVAVAPPLSRSVSDASFMGESIPARNAHYIP